MRVSRFQILLVGAMLIGGLITAAYVLELYSVAINHPEIVATATIVFPAGRAIGGLLLMFLSMTGLAATMPYRVVHHYRAFFVPIELWDEEDVVGEAEETEPASE